jgi:hypothetical protein
VLLYRADGEDAIYLEMRFDRVGSTEEGTYGVCCVNAERVQCGSARSSGVDVIAPIYRGKRDRPR